MTKFIAGQVEITPFSLIFWKGEEWRVEGETPYEWQITGRNDPNLFDVLIKADLPGHVKSGRLIVREEILDFLDLSIMSVAKRRKTALNMMWVSASKECFQLNLVEDFSQKSCEAIIRLKAAEVAERYRNHLVENDFAPTEAGRKINYGSLSPHRDKQHVDIAEDRVLLTARSLWDLLKRWEADPVPETLVPGWKTNTGGGKPMDQRTWAIVQQYGLTYAKETSRTYDGVLLFINAHITQQNKLLAQEAQIPPATAYMVRKAIEEIPEFAKMFTRRGPRNTSNLLRPVGRGPKFTRVGEEVILDGWETHLHTLLNDEVKAMFSLDVTSVRLRIVPAIDHATGYVFGLAGAPTGETAALTTKCLRMVGSDRTPIARAAGCISDWGPPIGVEILSQDSGSALWNQVYMQAAWVLANTVDHKAAGLAWLRGTVERLLRTIDTQFIQNFIGRTGSNILSRHENDPEKRAAITVDFFMRLFTRFIVDVYHHRSRREGRKSRMSPARELEAALRLQPKPAPDPDRNRLAFGIVRERMLTRSGVRFMNIEYSSAWLARPLRKRGPHMVTIKVDPMNLGRISVAIEGRWVTIPGPREFDGVDLQTWLEMGDHMARQVRAQAEVDFRTFVAPALLEIDAAARQAERQLGFLDLDFTAEMLDHAENTLRTFVVYDRAPIGDELGLSGHSSQLGKAITRPVHAEAEVRTTAASPPAASPPAVAAVSQKADAPVPTRRVPRSRR